MSSAAKLPDGSSLSGGSGPSSGSSLTIDGFTFARSGGRLNGVLRGSDVTRLAAATMAVVTVQYSIEGCTSPFGKPALRVRASGDVELQCQRCLDAVPVTIEVDQDLELASTQAAIDAAQDDVDRVLATRSMVVAVMVEDELILALPMVAHHDDCRAPNVNKQH
jgi:uncharacterized protein